MLGASLHQLGQVLYRLVQAHTGLELPSLPWSTYE